MQILGPESEILGTEPNNISRSSFSTHLAPRGNCCSDFFHYILVLPSFKFYLKKDYIVFFWVKLLVLSICPEVLHLVACL